MNLRPAAAEGRAVALAVACALTLHACSAGRRTLPHDVGASVRSGVQSICLWSVETDLDLAATDPRLASYEQVLAAELGSAGYTVVDSARTTAVWNKVLRDQGGYYDPRSGRRDAARYEHLKSMAGAALKTQLGCEALARPNLAVVRSRWSGTSAHWDGTRDELEGGAWGTSGTVLALSLWLRIGSLPADDEIYFRSGGVQVLAGMRRTGLLRKEWTTVGDQNILNDAARNRRSVQLAIEPILKSATASR